MPQLIRIFWVGSSAIFKFHLAIWVGFSEYDLEAGFIKPGVSVASTMSSNLIRDPVGEHDDGLRTWTLNNKAFLTDLQQQVTTTRTETEGETITLIDNINAKKAATTMQKEKYWIKVTIPSASSDDLYLYIGCSSCGRKGDILRELHTTASNVTGLPRAAFTFEAVDSSRENSPFSPKTLNPYFNKLLKKSMPYTMLYVHLSNLLMDQSKLELLSTKSCPLAGRLARVFASNWSDNHTKNKQLVDMGYSKDKGCLASQCSVPFANSNPSDLAVSYFSSVSKVL